MKNLKNILLAVLFEVLIIVITILNFMVYFKYNGGYFSYFGMEVAVPKYTIIGCIAAGVICMLFGSYVIMMIKDAIKAKNRK